VPNSNPIVANSSGQVGPVFLSPGASYKFVLQNPDGSSLYSQDNIGGQIASGLDVTGTAGEALTAGLVVYLSDGSGGKTAGLWYKADSANTYSSTTPEIGMTVAAISSGAAGSIRLSGTITGLAGLVVGSTYYVGTAGALTGTAPTNARKVGVADTTSSIVLKDVPTVPVVVNSTVQGRLTLTTAVPVTTADVTAATTIFFTPYGGNYISLYDGTNWNLVSFTEISIAVPATTVTTYDVFCFSNAGVATLELLAWTNDTTRATALVLQNGVLSKTGALTRRYLGTCRTTSVSGQTEDSFVKRFVWNYYNRVPRTLKRFEATDSWTYSTAAYRQANASASNQVECVVGVAEVEAHLTLVSMTSNSAADDNTFISISDQATTVSTTPDASVIGQPLRSGTSASVLIPGQAVLRKYPVVGHHVFGWLEQGSGTNTTTWYGDNGAATKYQSGLLGSIAG
jgi:hypothetical protein